jgi:hypothetical protein
MDADEPADGKRTVRCLLEKPADGFSHSAHAGSWWFYAIAINSSWSPTLTSGVSSRFIDSALK